MVGKRLRLLPVLLLLLALPALAQQSQSKESSQTVEFEAGGHLRLKTFKGSIHIRPWDRNQVEIKARIEPGEDVSVEYAARSVEATKVDVWGSGRSVTITSDYEDVPCRDDRWSFGCSKTLPYVHYQIRVPRKVDLSVDDHKSSIDVTGLAGRLEFDTHKGTVELADLAGEVQMKTHKGEVVLEGAEGRIELQSHKGRIDASDVTGDVRVQTHRGRITVSGLQGSVKAETNRGEISIRADKIDDASRLETYRGRIDLSLLGSQGLTVRARIGRRGDFQNDFAMTTRTTARDRIEGTINGGGPRLYLETKRGEIHLKRR